MQAFGEVAAIQQSRQQAMQRFYQLGVRSLCMPWKEPCSVKWRDREYYAFVDGASLVLTQESIDFMKVYDNSDNSFLQFDKMLELNGEDFSYDLCSIIRRASTAGYQLCDEELDYRSKFYFRVGKGFYQIGTVEKAFSIIDDGSVVCIRYCSERKPILITTSLGVALIMPTKVVYSEDVNVFY